MIGPHYLASGPSERSIDLSKGPRLENEDLPHDCLFLLKIYKIIDFYNMISYANHIVQTSVLSLQNPHF